MSPIDSSLHASGFVPPTARMSRGETDARTSVVTCQSTISGETPDAPPRDYSGLSLANFILSVAAPTEGASAGGSKAISTPEELIELAAAISKIAEST
ncbi:hypothetical protein EV360DRAFT_90375 [Lentinula raphanica]|nr:hypothetical protein EV360DRAFT_90375 [Lentinula raphanica]